MPTATRYTLQVQAFIGSSYGNLALHLEYCKPGGTSQREAYLASHLH
jgi:hypothetical protein